MSNKVIKGKRSVPTAGFARYNFPTVEEVLNESSGASMPDHQPSPFARSDGPMPPLPETGPIRSASSPGSIATPEEVTAILHAAEQKAGTIKAEAEMIRQQARNEAENVQREAKEQGYSDGMAEAQRIAQEKLSGIMANLHSTHERLSRLKNDILRQNEEEIIGLALDIAQKIIGAELTLNQAAVVSVIKSALDRIDLSQQITVKIHPADYDYLQNNAPAFLKNVWMVADTGVSPGGAFIETESGNFDAQIESQIKEIEKKLRKEMLGEE